MLCYVVMSRYVTIKCTYIGPRTTCPPLPITKLFLSSLHLCITTRSVYLKGSFSTLPTLSRLLFTSSVCILHYLKSRTGGRAVLHVYKNWVHLLAFLSSSVKLRPV